MASSVAAAHLDKASKPPRSAEATKRNRRWRLPFLGLGLCFFLGALYGGLWRLGWDIPHASRLGELHGPLMICGFFGTLIGLERAVALGGHWAFLAPALSCLGAALAVGGAPFGVAAFLFTSAATILVAGSFVSFRDRFQRSTIVLATGALCWGVGDVSWLITGDAPSAAPWWLLFLVLTIVAEGLGGRGLPSFGRASAAALLACVMLLIAGAIFGMYDANGARFLGAGLVALSLWLFRYDIARGGPRLAPHRQFAAFAMFAGYLWIGLAGCALILAPPAVAPYGYDLALHAILIGFVLSMAMGHSVNAIPAITGAAAPFHSAMYVGLGLLHLSVALRVCADLTTWDAGRMTSGPLTLLALTAFGGVLARQIRASG